MGRRAWLKRSVARWCDWSGRLDSNQRPPAPKAGALPGCATPRLPESYRIARGNGETGWLPFLSRPVPFVQHRNPRDDFLMQYPHIPPRLFVACPDLGTQLFAQARHLGADGIIPGTDLFTEGRKALLHLVAKLQ